MKVLWVILAAVVTVEGFYYPPQLDSEPFAAFDQEYFEESFEPLTTSELFLENSLEDYEIPSVWELFRPEPRYMNYIAQPKSVLNYKPVRKDSRVAPNVFLNGQGYTTDRYVAPSVVKRFLAMNPR